VKLNQQSQFDRKMIDRLNSRMFALILALSLFGISTTHAQDFETFKARNGVSMDYTVLLPEGYDASKGYEAVLAFEDTYTDQSDAEAMIETLWAEPAHRAGWIVVVPLTPGEDWRTHPIHHALNDLMDEVSQNYSVHHNKYHILGYGQGGTDIASTWSSMSREYFNGLVAIGGTPYDRWDDDDAQRFLRGDGKDLEIVLLNSEHAESESMQRFKERAQSVEKHVAETAVSEAEMNHGGALGALAHSGR